jgi:alkaline phosphatase D
VELPAFSIEWLSTDAFAGRYHRDDYKTLGGDFLGAAQWAWLERELTDSTAAFNVIVSGIQVLPTDRFFPAESWSRFPSQRERLLELILQSNAKGVILLRYCLLCISDHLVSYRMG